MRGVFAVGEPAGQRWELALDLLRRGEPFSIGQTTFRRVNPETIEVAVASEWWDAGTLTDKYAREALGRAKEGVEELLASDPGFGAAIGDSTIDYVLVDDYDIGAITLCRLVGDDLKWLTSRRG